MFEYQRRAEAKGQALPCAIVRDLPSSGVGWARSPTRRPTSASSRWWAAPGRAAPDRAVRDHRPARPASAEIVIEGEILRTCATEGPFGEFTGYVSRTLDRHVSSRRRSRPRERPWFQSIAPDARATTSRRSPDPRGEIANALARVIPNVRGVHVRCRDVRRHGLVSIAQSRPARPSTSFRLSSASTTPEAGRRRRHDIDVFDDRKCSGPVATRMQADRDLVVVSGSPARCSTEATSGASPPSSHRRDATLRRAVPPRSS